MSRMLLEFDDQLKNLNRGISFMDKEAILFHEIDLQLKIFALITVVGAMMILLGVLV